MGRFYLLAGLAVIVSIITLASFLKFQRYAFYNKSDIKRDKIKEVPFPMVFSMVILSIICLILSLLIIPEIREAILTPAINILTDPLKYSSTIIGQ
jgi:multicomponent Na+:H+ antiporter subunit D